MSVSFFHRSRSAAGKMRLGVDPANGLTTAPIGFEPWALEFKHRQFAQQCSHSLTEAMSSAAHLNFECYRETPMRCSNLSVNGKSCVCALLLAMPCVMVLANAQFAYAQT